MQHRAHGRHSEVGLEVLLVVPEERPDPVARLDPQRRQPVGQAGRALGHLSVRPFLPAAAVEGEDATVGVDRRAVLEDRGDQPGRVLHGALHGIAHGILQARAAPLPAVPTPPSQPPGDASYGEGVRRGER